MAFDTQLFNDIFNTSPIGIAIENLDGQLLFVNSALCSFLGFNDEEMRKKHCVDFSPPEDAQKDWALFQKLREGLIDHYQLDKRYFRKDGSLVWGRLSLSLLKTRSPLVIAMVEDITEQKRVEELRFLHAAIVDSSEDAIASVTLDGVIASWNAGAQRLYGYTEREAVGKSVAILVPPELSPEEDKILETMKAGGSIRQFETVRVTKTGGRINVSLSISAIKDSNGRIVGFSGIARDITERKQAEDKLREYQRAVEGAEDMIAVVDREYRYLIANRQFLNRRNMRREQVVGHYAQEVLSRDFFERVVKARLDECFQGKVVRYETKYTYPELGERDLIISYFPIEGADGIDRVACIMHDITDRKRGEEALRESEQRLRLAAEAGKMYSFEWDVANDVVVRSPQRVKVLGAKEPLRSSHEQFMNTVHSDDRPKFVAAITGLTPEKPTAEVIYRLQNSDGSLVWLRSSGRAFFDSEGKLLRVIGMVADITDLKRAEEAASGMTRKLVEAQEQERARIGRELHDDITQRLTLLSLKMEQIDENPSDMQSHLAKLRADMIQISTDIEALSRELHSTKLQYLGLVAATKSWCREFGDRHKVRVIFTNNISSNPPFEVGRSLFRVLQEATSNAVKYSGIDAIEVRLWDDAAEIHLMVHDSGKGFDVNVALQGEGLGLTSMRERVRLINGTISIDSMPNRGTTIYVHVPLPKEQDSHPWAV